MRSRQRAWDQVGDEAAEARELAIGLRQVLALEDRLSEALNRPSVIIDWPGATREEQLRFLSERQRPRRISRSQGVQHNQARNPGEICGVV
jgi:hypothetical protein